MISTLGKPLTIKKCSRCNKVKKVAEFHKHGIRYRKQRYRPMCTECFRGTVDKVKRREIQKRHYQRNKQYYFDRNLKSKKRYKKATPPWVNFDKVREIYAKMRQLNEMSKDKLLVVDHIIPIKGKTVCGLHVHYNLQIVTETYNKQKGSIYDPVLYPEQGLDND